VIDACTVLFRISVSARVPMSMIWKAILRIKVEITEGLDQVP
jgi:hypothetical protein